MPKPKNDYIKREYLGNQINELAKRARRDSSKMSNDSSRGKGNFVSSKKITMRYKWVV
jgi:hypothetical protein